MRRAIPPEGHGGPSGFGLIYFIGLITFIAAIVVALFAMAPKPAIFEAKTNYMNQAQSLAQAGMNYVASKNAEFLQSNATNLNPTNPSLAPSLGSLNGFSYTPPGANGGFSLQVTQDGTGTNWVVRSTGTSGGVATTYAAQMSTPTVSAGAAPPPPNFPSGSFQFNNPSANYTTSILFSTGNIIARNVTISAISLFTGSICAYGDIEIQSLVLVGDLAGNPQNAIYAQGNITVDSLVQVGDPSGKFNLCTMKSFSMDDLAAVYGNIYALSTVPAQGNVTIATFCTLSGDIYAKGNVVIGSYTTVTGNVYANGSVTVQSGARINGNVTYKGVLTNYGTITGTRTNGTNNLGTCPNCS